MVVILQQTSENGKRFTSTVVAESPTPTSHPTSTTTTTTATATTTLNSHDTSPGTSNRNLNSEDHQNHHQEETTSSSSSQTGGGSGGIPSPYNSNFSFASQNSISERSAIYKQRIDSLFGRHSRLTPFKPNLERFCIRIDGTGVNLSPNMMSLSSLASPGSSDSSASAASSPGNHLSKSKKLQQQQHNHIHPAPFEETDNHILSSSAHDDDDSDSDVDQNYQKIEKKLIQHKRKSKKVNQSLSSIVTDSLSKSATANTSGPIHSGLNVSSVQINCEEPTCSGSGGSFSGSISISPRSSKDEPMICPINNNNNKAIIWRNGDYSTKSPQETKHRSSSTNSGSRRNEPCAILSPTGVLRFPVEYLGSIPVEGNTTTLHDLQIPLRVLYLDFLQGRNISTGQLAITSDGLKFESSKLRLVNPFTTIAVWAAIKFVARCNTSECAFMPLISDPEGQDKKSLFSKMDSELTKVYFSCINTGNKNFRNPPIFACVMREASYILKCHAFATKCPEDAIVIAANLYQSLVDKMRSSKKEGESGYSSSSPAAHAHLGLSPTNHNNRSISSASNDKLSSSSCSHIDDDADHHHQQHPIPILCMSTTTRVNREKLRVVFSDSESIIPVRPPRRKKKGGGYYALGSGGCSGDSDKKRYNSDDSILRFSSSAKKKIPQRRKSFKSSHNFYHYQTRQQQPFIQHQGNYKKGNGIMSSGNGGKRDDKKKHVKIAIPPEEELAITGGGTDFSEPINDSIDQVLDRIINPGGMSWNDLKPGYQELILKIALTLTQDQLYQKSKQAMKKHQNQLIYVNGRDGGGKKHKSKSKFTSKSSNRTDSNEDSQFLNQLLKSFSKIGGINNKVSSGSPPQPPPRNKVTADEAKSGKIILQLQSNAILKKRNMSKCSNGRGNADTIGQDSLYSFCSGCVCENCSEKCYCSLPSKQNLKFVTTLPSIAASPINPTPSPTLQISAQHDPITCKETDIDIDILPNQDHIHQSDSIAHKQEISKSATNTSEKSVIKKKTCGYDTDLQRVKSNGLKIYNINLDTETSDTDTNSYDFEPFNQQQDDDQIPSCSSSAVKTNSAKSTVEVLSYNQGRFSYSQSPTSGNSPLLQTTTTNAQIHMEEKNVDKTPFLSPHQKNGLLLGKAVAEIAASRVYNINSNNQIIASYSSKMQSGNGRQADLGKKAMNSDNDDDEIHTSDENSKNSKKEKVLLITGASNPSAKVIYKEPNGFHFRKDTISRGWRNLSENDEDAESENSDDDDDDIVPEKMISMKKTAEIVADFSQLRVDKKCRGDARLLGKKLIDSENNNTEKSVDFESSLGYLP